MVKLKKIPYGVSNFKKLKEKSLYIDKTHFIELLEDKYEFLSFLRPRRFGKSLFISTLSYYYDEYYKNDFETIYEDFTSKIDTLLRTYLDRYKIEIANAITELALNKNLDLFQKEVKNVINLLSNRDYMKFEEKHLKVILLTILNITTFYYIKSEAEYNKNYPDIMLLKQEPFEVKFQYLFELKWVKKGIKGDWSKKNKEGLAQVKKYKKLKDIKNIENLYSYLIISDGDNLEIIEV